MDFVPSSEAKPGEEVASGGLHPPYSAWLAGRARGGGMHKPIVRPAMPSDAPDLRRAVIEMQEYERRLHASRLPGEEIADAYLAWLVRQAERNGAVLVAEADGSFAGFATG
jgi:hypothetical protein